MHLQAINGLEGPVTKVALEIDLLLTGGFQVGDEICFFYRYFFVCKTVLFSLHVST